VNDDHLLLNANYLKSHVYRYLIGNCRETYSATDLADLKRTLIAQARHTLSLVPEQTDIPYYRDIVRASCNAVAWYTAELTDDNTILQDALAALQPALNVIETAQHYFLYDTQVREWNKT